MNSNSDREGLRGERRMGHSHTRLIDRVEWAFSVDTIMGVLRTYPTILMGGILQENPFFVPPNRFLGKIRERRAN